MDASSVDGPAAASQPQAQASPKAFGAGDGGLTPQAALPAPSSSPTSDEGSKASSWWRRRWAWQRWLVIGVAGALGAAMAAAASVAAVHRCRSHHGGPKRRRGRAGRHAAGSAANASADASDGDAAVRIPLKEVVRFKERQWFLEDLEASRQGDSNAMLRLAKMYLHGQGCTQSLGMATEWLRKARSQGLYGTLEELWAGEPEELERLRLSAARAAAITRRRAVEAQQIRGQQDEAPWVPSAR